jgi:hypothetical protein
MLRRADRALITAKEKGRNRVVQLGSGLPEHSENKAAPVAEAPKGISSWWTPWQAPPPATIVQAEMTTAVPAYLAIEKLKGFVSDQKAEIVSVDKETLQIRIDGYTDLLLRRTSDRPVPLLITVKLLQDSVELQSKRTNTRTKIKLSIEPIRSRDRRKSDLQVRAHQIVASIKSYLMAVEDNNTPVSNLERAATESGR